MTKNYISIHAFQQAYADGHDGSSDDVIVDVMGDAEEAAGPKEKEEEEKPNGRNGALKVPLNSAAFLAVVSTTAGEASLGTVVKTLLGSPVGDEFFQKCVRPVMEGDLSYGDGRLAADRAVLGYELMKADKAHHNLLAKARAPKGRTVCADTVGAKIVSLIDKGWFRKKGSLEVTALRITKKDG